MQAEGDKGGLRDKNRRPLVLSPGTMRLGTTLLIICSFFTPACSLGCMATVCKGNANNELVSCNGKVCGNYKSERQGGELVDGVDVKCSPESPVYAPFDGDMYFWRPYGNREGFRCADEGVRIEGTGQWQGYHVLMVAVRLDFFGGRVQKGQRIGVAIDNRCTHGGTGEEYIRIKLFKQGRAIDPTFHLRECMCTGQICETNPKNELLGQPFQHDSRFNGVRGWDIRCPMAVEDEEEQRVPDIYSPIEAEVVGRSRLYADQGVYSGCDNNGVVLIGTGAWKDFEVVLYNVRYREHILGRQRVVQGEPIATRLDCGNSPDSVFMEVRYRGIVSDISNMISAKMCKMPDFPPR